jgi:hypothetical protein
MRAYLLFGRGSDSTSKAERHAIPYTDAHEGLGKQGSQNIAIYDYLGKVDENICSSSSRRHHPI